VVQLGPALKLLCPHPWVAQQEDPVIEPLTGAPIVRPEPKLQGRVKSVVPHLAVNSSNVSSWASDRRATEVLKLRPDPTVKPGTKAAARLRVTGRYARKKVDVLGARATVRRMAAEEDMMMDGDGVLAAGCRGELIEWRGGRSTAAKVDALNWKLDATD
jgi:hypothetical protein